MVLPGGPCRTCSMLHGTRPETISHGGRSELPRSPAATHPGFSSYVHIASPADARSALHPTTQSPARLVRCLPDGEIAV